MQDEFKEQEKESSSSGQQHNSYMRQNSGFKKGSFIDEDQPPASSSRALIGKGRGAAKRAQFRKEWFNN